MGIKNKTAELLYGLMITADERRVSKLAVKLLNSIQGFRAHEQLLSLSAALVCLLDIYDLSAADTLGTAHNIIYDTSNPDVDKDFKAIKHYMKTEWNL